MEMLKLVCTETIRVNRSERTTLLAGGWPDGEVLGERLLDDSFS